MSRQFFQKKLDLIELIDQEILKTNEQLASLRAELINIYNSKGTAHRNALLEKSIQVDLPREVAVQVNLFHDDDRFMSEPTKLSQQAQSVDGGMQIGSNDSAISSCTSCDECNYHKVPIHLDSNEKKLVTSPAQDPINTNHRLRSSFSGSSSNKLSSSEERYLNKLRKIMQNRIYDSQNQQYNTSRCIETHNCSQTDLADNEELASFIAGKVSSKLKDLIPIEERGKKVYRNVEVETTLPLPQNGNYLADSNEETISLLEDDTIYMNLPASHRNRGKSLKSNCKVVFDPNEASFSSTLTSYYEPPVKRSTPLLQMDLIKDNSKVMHKHDKSQMLSLKDTSCDTALFATLPEVTSNCSTPKKDHSPVQQLRCSPLETVKSANLDISTYFSADSLNTDFTIRTSMDMSNFDRNQFWKEIFGNTSVDWPSDIGAL